MYSLSKEESERIRIIRSMAIVMVVFLHAYTTDINFAEGNQALILPEWLRLLETCISQIVSRCGVPIFFVLSSVLLFGADRPYRDAVSKKVKTLFVPYAFWNTFWIAVFIILQALPFTAPYFSGNNTPILQCSIRQWLGLYGIGQEYPQCYPLWFMRELMWLVLISPLIKAVVGRFPKIMLCAAALAVIYPFSLTRITSLAWFVIGAVIVRMNFRFTVLDRFPVGKMGAFYFIWVILALFVDNNLFRNAAILIGVFFWLRFSREIYVREKIKRKVLNLSEWVFLIYVLHELTLSSMRKLCLRMFPVGPTWLFLEYLFLPLFVILCCIAGGIVLKRFAPRFYRMTTGGR